MAEILFYILPEIKLPLQNFQAYIFFKIQSPYKFSRLQMLHYCQVGIIEDRKLENTKVEYLHCYDVHTKIRQ
jgi:hypothetical protein